MLVGHSLLRLFSEEFVLPYPVPCGYYLESVCVCVCERECVCVCVSVFERKREKDNVENILAGVYTFTLLWIVIFFCRGRGRALKYGTIVFQDSILLALQIIRSYFTMLFFSFQKVSIYITSRRGQNMHK